VQAIAKNYIDRVRYRKEEEMATAAELPKRKRAATGEGSSRGRRARIRLKKLYCLELLQSL